MKKIVLVMVTLLAGCGETREPIDPLPVDEKEEASPLNKMLGNALIQYLVEEKARRKDQREEDMKDPEKAAKIRAESKKNIMEGFEEGVREAQREREAEKKAAKENKKQRQLGHRGIAKCRSCKHVFYHSGAASCPGCGVQKTSWDYLKPNSAEANAFRASVAEKEKLKKEREKTFQIFYAKPERWETEGSGKIKSVIYEGDRNEVLKGAIAFGEKEKWDGVWLKKNGTAYFATFFMWYREGQEE